MYQVEIKWADGEGEGEIFATKWQAVRFLAKHVGEPQRSISAEVAPKTDSAIKRDSKGWRARVWYS